MFLACSNSYFVLISLCLKALKKKKKTKEYIENLVQESVYERAKRDFRTSVNVWALNIFEFLLSDLTLNGYSWWWSASLLRKPLPRHNSLSALLKIIFSFVKKQFIWFNQRIITLQYCDGFCHTSTYSCFFLLT